mmetsp:Transcript_59077/g.86497  ORF Transcript_59077/g.86497 Transcript_59077/m.86497 type:complete len:208 (+) Transcript_59077:617-1240(+)
MSTSARRDHSSNCSTAAARKVSQAPTTTRRPPSLNREAILPTVVVLPMPFAPIIINTVGEPGSGLDFSLRLIRAPLPSSTSISFPRRMVFTSSGSSLSSTAVFRTSSKISKVVATPISEIIRISSRRFSVSSTRISLPPKSAFRSPSNACRDFSSPSANFLFVSFVYAPASFNPSPSLPSAVFLAILLAWPRPSWALFLIKSKTIEV